MGKNKSDRLNKSASRIQINDLIKISSGIRETRNGQTRSKLIPSLALFSVRLNLSEHAALCRLPEFLSAPNN